MTTLLFATELEAAAMRALIPDQPLVITGMGPEAAYRAVMALPASCKELCNAGFAGALDTYALGTIHEIALTGREGHEPITWSGTGLRLLTLDAPLHDMERAATLRSSYDLVDMEGHAIALAAQRRGLRVRLIKIVSDWCTPDTPHAIRRNSAELSALLASYCATCHHRL